MRPYGSYFNEADQFWIWIGFLVFLLILAIVQLIAWFRFNSMRHLVIFEKRYPRLVLFEASMILAWLLLVGPILTKSHYASNWWIDISPFVTDIICWPITCLCFILESGRLWLMAFDLHHLHHSQNQKWRSLIDGSESNWYLKNKKTFGNAKKVQIAMAFFYFLPMLVYVILYFVESDAQMDSLRPRANQIILFLNEFFVFGLAFKCRKLTEIKDNLFFHWEIRVTAIIWLVGNALFTILMPVESVAAHLDAPSVVVGIMFVVIMVVGMLMLVLPSLVSTLWIPHKIVKSVLWECENGSKIVGGRRATDYPHTVESVPESMTLEDMIQCGERWEKLMTWMFKEFNAELGLFLIEIIQFKQYMVSHLLVECEDQSSLPSLTRTRTWTLTSTNSANGCHRYLQCTNDSMPRSAIIQETAELTTLDENAKCKVMAQLLFDKYMRVNAEFMLNLAGETRTMLTRLEQRNWEMESKEEFVMLFDPMIRKMMGLANASFGRYCMFNNSNPRPQ